MTVHREQGGLRGECRGRPAGMAPRPQLAAGQVQSWPIEHEHGCSSPGLALCTPGAGTEALSSTRVPGRVEEAKASQSGGWHTAGHQTWASASLHSSGHLLGRRGTAPSSRGPRPPPLLSQGLWVHLCKWTPPGGLGSLCHRAALFPKNLQSAEVCWAPRCTPLTGERLPETSQAGHGVSTAQACARAQQPTPPTSSPGAAHAAAAPAREAAGTHPAGGPGPGCCWAMVFVCALQTHACHFCRTETTEVMMGLVMREYFKEKKSFLKIVGTSLPLLPFRGVRSHLSRCHC